MSEVVETSSEYKILEQAEQDIYQYQLAADQLKPLYVQAGEALAWIKETKSYKRIALTFEEYCKSRWGYSRQRAYQIIDAATTIVEMSTIVDKTEDHPEGQSEGSDQEMSTRVDKTEDTKSESIGSLLPKTESQARELNSLETPEEQVEAMKRANEIAKEKDREVTAKDVKQAVNERKGVNEMLTPSNGPNGTDQSTGIPANQPKTDPTKSCKHLAERVLQILIKEFPQSAPDYRKSLKKIEDYIKTELNK